MKTRYNIVREARYNEKGEEYEVIRSFKHKPEAIAFFNDTKNKREYGTMYIIENDAEGSRILGSD